ncbi:DUF1553 domain-containing protein [Roseimaritima ulvae]|uniref:Planctomycete cytochrome C n=1 Tax=Roseimaritima ulvae TaxID=980254 RepID=A0A5B9QMM5_9BACT|nr:DUF1553 domain-containing protein [Roseimaritima ulvae]QEG38266.1 Planctomycete cytochrome C [Roseimaritima ulvae]
MSQKIRCVLLTVLACWSYGPVAHADQREQFFETKIRPVLVQHCYECHSADAEEIGGKLLVDSRDAMLTGGESGPVLQAGQPEQSLLIQALRYDDLQMPPDAPLPEATINDFVKWVSQGAVDPRTESTAPKTQASLDNEALWSFFPPIEPPLPTVADSHWPRDPIDHFVLARMQSAGLAPADDADPRTLIRRLHYDLIGLPPSADQVDAFVAAYEREGQTAVERLVDTLLISPQFGVRWGRHWLDVARYGESNGDDGLGRNATFPHAWRYRDYVIDAFNRDVPYNRFLTEQIAGDLLPADTAAQRNRQLTATGFLAIGSKPAVAMNSNFAMDVVDDQINAVCTTVMGLSVACARCHDHKHDPIPTRDYYALAGIFSSTETLYGAAGNEKLTAPPTPLHELTTTLPKPGPRPDRKGTPKFPADYSSVIDSLQPVFHAKLDVAPESLTTSPAPSYSADTFATVKDTTIRGEFPEPTPSYSVSFWFRNQTPNNTRPITAYLFSRAKLGDKALPGDHLGIGGKHDKARTGKLFVFNGNATKKSVVGTTVIPTGTWNHITMVRDGRQMKVFLNGQLEINQPLEPTFGDSQEFCLANRSDNFAPLNGNLGEVALFSRALGDEQAMQLHTASGQPRGLRPPPAVGYAMGVRDKPKPVDCKIHINGQGNKLGPQVPRGTLTAYHTLDPDAPDVTQNPDMPIDGKHSGRLELAAWLTDPNHPQTARVMANRVWLHLFGQGIVTTPDDFGVYGARPSHPELLDHLALRFVQQNWSIKRLIRAIVLSRTYQLSSHGDADTVAADPDNRWLARQNRRRLDAESLRDSMLQASGALDYAPGQGSAIAALDQLINWPLGQSTNLHRPSQHRSVYLCMLRHAAPKELAAFDLPDGVGIAGKRDSTTLPSQTLFLLNSEFVVQQSQHLAARLLQESTSDDAQRVQRAFVATLQRTADESEVAQALALVASTRAALRDAPEGPADDTPDQPLRQAWACLCQALMTTNEFRYVD